MSAWNKLPKEILLSLFSQDHRDVLLSQKQVLRCSYVCKGWKLAAQLSVYQNLELTDGNETTKRLIAAFNGKEQKVSELVKTIKFYVLEPKDSYFKTYMVPLAIMFPYVEKLISDYSETRCFYEYLIHVGLDGRWKFLKEFSAATHRENINMYITAALAYKDNLTYLEIQEEITEDEDEDRDTHAYDNKQHDRLVSQLQKFTSLESLLIIKRTNDFDYLLKKCPKLTTLQVITLDSDEPILSKVDLKEIGRNSTLKSLDLNWAINDNNAMAYIMHKFQNLEKIHIGDIRCDRAITIQHINITLETLLRFFHFLENVADRQVEIYLNESLIHQLIESSKNVIEYLRISYSNLFILDDSDLHDKKDIASLGIEKSRIDHFGIYGLSLNYGYTVQHLPHLRLLEKYGHLVKHLEIGFFNNTGHERTADSNLLRDLKTGYFLDHIFKYCSSLKHLYLKGDRLEHCNPSMSKSYSITTLTLLSKIQREEVYHELSVRLVALKHLTFIVHPHSYDVTSFKLTFSYTDLETFTFNTSFNTRIIIKISTVNEVLFYSYHGSGKSTRPKVVELNLEEYKTLSAEALLPTTESSYLKLNLFCKTIKQLIIFADSYITTKSCIPNQS